MADTTPGATAPTTARRRVITSTLRSRRQHGVFLVGGHVVGIYSRPSTTAPGAVSITAGHSQLMLDGALSPDQARALARALHAAAGAAEATGSVPSPSTSGSVYSALSPLGDRVLLPTAPGSINGKLLAHYRAQLDARRIALGVQHPRTLAAEAQLRGWAGLVIDTQGVRRG